MSIQSIDDVRVTLQQTGAAIALGPDGKRIFFVLDRVLNAEERGILISYETHGSFFFNLDRPLNSFRLASAGFSLRVAPGLAKTVNDLLMLTDDEAQVAVALPQLTSATVTIED